MQAYLMANSNHPTVLQITLGVCAEPHSEQQDRGHHRQCHRELQRSSCASFSTPTHLTNDSSDLRSTRAAALIFTL